MQKERRKISCRFFGNSTDGKAEQSLQSLKKLYGPEAKVLRDGSAVQIPARELVIGDVILLEAGDMIPADGRLIENASLKVDESALTISCRTVSRSHNSGLHVCCYIEYIKNAICAFDWLLVAFTALIPIFGAFIGCAVGSFLIFMVSPKQAVLFIIIFLLLQQIEGNLIYPHVVGGSVGLPSIWVLAAVTIVGILMGIVGMLIFIPTVSVFYTIFREYVYLRLKKQNIKRVTRTEVEEYDKRM